MRRLAGREVIADDVLERLLHLPSTRVRVGVELRPIDIQEASIRLPGAFEALVQVARDFPQVLEARGDLLHVLHRGLVHGPELHLVGLRDRRAKPVQLRQKPLQRLIDAGLVKCCPNGDLDAAHFR